MNKDTGEIVEMSIDEAKELEKQFAKGLNQHMVPIPNDKLSALNNLSIAQRMAWARSQRPSLEAVVAAGAELTPTQRKAHEKQERKRQQRLAAGKKNDAKES